MNKIMKKNSPTESPLKKKKTIKITVRYHITITLTKKNILKVLIPHIGKATVKPLSCTLFMGV